MHIEQQSTPDFAVVVNDEQQYSLWPTIKTLPEGWKYTGFEGDREACLAHIDTVWTDMRPASLKAALEATA